MKGLYLSTFLVAVFFASPVFATAPSISFSPETIIQGDPVMVTIDGVPDISSIKKMTFDSKTVPVFLFNAKPTALLAIDLDKKVGTYPVVITFSDGQTATKNIEVTKRPIIEAPLGIPESLGGNTAASAKTLVTNLVNEKAIVTDLWTNPKKLWTEKFRFPLPTITVTDIYGYSRQTVGYSIAHKGTDFHAVEGTPVSAMNRGVVRLVRTLPSYGKTVVIDHGQGIMTLYLHLSKFKVSEGQLVQIGQVIGLSGQTGYAEGAHLHVSIKVAGISIDPMVFMGFFK